MNTINTQLVANLSTRKLWQILNTTSKPTPQTDIARKELISRNQYEGQQQFNRPH